MPERILHAGPFHMIYRHGFLRHISYGHDEILRMIYFALRDENWATLTTFIENEIIDQHADHFEIHYDCFHERDGQKIYTWKVAITGSARGSINFDIHGEAITDVLKNRAGFCVLHPLVSSGAPCITVHPDGSSEDKRFPDHVSPTNPFKGLKELQWKAQQHWFILKFEGDIFETEDQRNWSDASFKTFCTPLDNPFPVLIKKGDNVNQCIRFEPMTALPELARPPDMVIITATDRKIKLAKVGIGASTEAQVNEKIIRLLKTLRLHHYRVDLNFCQSSWRTAFESACKLATKLEVPLEIAATVTDKFQDEINGLIHAIEDHKPAVSKILFLSLDSPATRQSVVDHFTEISRMLPGVLLGAGTDFNFTELNRNRINATGTDFVSFSIHPQEHAFDDLSLIENTEAQQEVVRSAQHIYPGKSIHVSPLTLRKRFNPYASDQTGKIMTNDGKSDPRQAQPFGAVFTAASIKQLSLAGAASVTLFQTVGNQGIISEAGEPFPIYNLLKEMMSDTFNLIVTKSSHPLKADALLLESAAGKKMIVVNYSDRVQQVLLPDHSVVNVEPYDIIIR